MEVCEYDPLPEISGEFINAKELFDDKNISRWYGTKIGIYPRHLTYGDGTMILDLKYYDLDNASVTSFKIEGCSALCGVNYVIESGGASIYESTVPEDGELLPKDFVLMNCGTIFHDTRVIFKGVPASEMLKSPWTISLKFISYTDEFRKRIDLAKVMQIVRNGACMANLYIMCSGMAGMWITEYIKLDNLKNLIEKTATRNVKETENLNDKILTKYPRKTRKEQMDEHNIEGFDVTLGKLQAFQFTKECKEGASYMYPLVFHDPYHITISPKVTSEVRLSNYYFTKCGEDYTHKLTIRVVRSSCLVNDLHIVLPNCKVPVDVKLNAQTLPENMKDHNLENAKVGRVVQAVELDTDQAPMVAIKGNPLLNLVGMNGDFRIVIECLTRSDECPYEGATLSYKELFLSSMLRARVRKLHKPTVTLKDLEDLSYTSEVEQPCACQN